MSALFPATAAAVLALLAAAPAGALAPLASPALSSLQIEIWPEYDRPQTLVILKGELAADTRLPAQVSLRIPAAAGGPSAAAYADASGNLINLQYQLDKAAGAVLVRLTTPQRAFHVEFYDPLASSQPAREYRYDWPGDLRVERLAVLVKQPAAASGLSVTPALAQAGTGPDGLAYRAGDFGPLKAGEKLAIAVRYTKTDTRLTSEILRESAAGAAPPAPARRDTLGLWLVGIGLAGLLAAGGGFLFVRARERKALLEAAPPAKAGACPRCGKQAAAGSRFCASCGTPLKR
jgi:hypothetical protein